MAFLMEDYINPSSQPKVDLDEQRLVCLGSGGPVRDEVVKGLRSVEEMGAKQHKEIFEKQIQSNIKHKLSSIN